MTIALIEPMVYQFNFKNVERHSSYRCQKFIWQMLLLLAAFFSMPVAAKEPSCASAPEPDPTGLQFMKDCISKAAPSALTGKAAFVDVDKGLLYLVDDNSESGYICYEVAVGSNSQGDPAQLGNEPGSNKTPGGLTLTGRHDGDKYKTDDRDPNRDAIGMKPVASKNNQTENRGVVMHPATGEATAGCIGIKNGKFPEIKNALGTDGRNAIFMFGKQMMSEGNPQSYCDSAGGNTGGGKTSSEAPASGGARR